MAFDGSRILELRLRIAPLFHFSNVDFIQDGYEFYRKVVAFKNQKRFNAVLESIAHHPLQLNIRSDASLSDLREGSFLHGFSQFDLDIR